MKKIILFLFLASALPLMPQTKYFIYFKDKGPNSGSALAKGSAEYAKALNSLSSESIERRKKHLGNENIISEDDLPVNENYISELEKNGIKIEKKLKWFNAVSAYLSDNQVKELNKFPFINKTEKVKTLSGINTPAINDELGKISKTNTIDPVYGAAYDQLVLSDIIEVHKKGIKGNGVRMGFLDSGFDWKTPFSLKNAKVIGEYDFVFNDNVTSDQAQDSRGQHDHGTAVFSTVAANKPGKILGVAYEASYFLAKTEYVPTESKVEEDNFAAGIEWLESRGIDIATTSVGYNTFDNAADSYTYKDMDGQTSICTRAYEKAFSLGVTTFSSAGNEGANSWKYVTVPADGFNVIAVGSIDNWKNLAATSSRGPTYDKRTKPEVTAQGISVYSTAASSTDSYVYMSGTSLAAPIAAGVGTLLLSAYPNLKNTQIREILLLTAENAASPNNNIGWGLVSASRAIAYPNIENIGTNYRINKIIFNKNGIIAGSVKVSVSDDGQTFKAADMTQDGIYFRYNLQPYSSNKKIYFYFDYSDSLGNKIREPEKLYYSFNAGSTSVKYSGGSATAEDFNLYQNYPNPFNGATNIDFIAKTDGQAVLKIYDALGKEIKTVYNRYLPKGYYHFNINLNSIASGVYYYRLELNGQLITKKMILNK